MQLRLDSPRTLGAALREARAAQGLTQAELADKAGVSRAFVMDLERGARSRAELVRVLAVVAALGKSLVLADDDGPATFDAALGEVLR